MDKLNNDIRELSVDDLDPGLRRRKSRAQGQHTEYDPRWHPPRAGDFFRRQLTLDTRHGLITNPQRARPPQ
jgi:hypothetical protein